MTPIKKSLLVLAVALIGIQFIRPDPNSSSAISANDITLHCAVPDTVLALLKRSCYDCHSNNTVYPWYDRVQPVAWWLQYHVNHGKHSLNFSEFAGYAMEKQGKKLKAVSEEVREGGMPLDSYLWIHSYASLSPGEKAVIAGWADSLRSQISVKK
ncbi:MAG TPA: heme-binding domain-containing protein [Puia sp.]|nr:heme-binding domain-containing protein [Puia sp.]